MPFIFVGLLTALLSLIVAVFLPSSGGVEKQSIYNTQAQEDMNNVESAMRDWFTLRMDRRTGDAYNSAECSPAVEFILPACTTAFNRMMDVFSPKSIVSGDANRNSYYIKYLYSNTMDTFQGNGSLAIGGTPPKVIQMVPLTTDTAGNYTSIPVAVIAAAGVNGVWDIPTLPVNGKVVPDPNILLYLADSTQGTPIASVGDDVFRVVMFDDIVQDAVARSREVFRDVLTGLGVFFNEKSIGQPGYYPLTLDDFATWAGALEGRVATNAPSESSPITVDGFGYPLYYSPTNFFLDVGKTKPLQVDVQIDWFAHYQLN